ncbi:hypothetical protein [Neisseria shayeganii]|uniref:Lipoprotein n=1 Tax=Neisseria shayeganii TaxID=607712 RepID=A0A7D7SGS6_9NEIS|nr:hypothetical protein [Neisseria shayeganii]QMT39527.1 hypothetical protein H3L94_06475 [Neisseria shayeganii]
MLTSRRYGLCLAAALWLAGCFELEPLTHQSWKEEVELSDGTVILVERRLVVQEGGLLPESIDKILKNEVEVLDAKGLPPPPVWSDKWKPMVLDRDEHGVWFMVVIPRHCFDWNSSFAYRQYKAYNGGWQQVEFDMGLNLRRPNIEWYIKKEMPEILRLRDKPEWEKGGGGTAPEYRIIDTSYRSGC